MNKLYRKAILLSVVALSFASAQVHAQYYDVGARPLGQKWRMIRTDSLRMVFPQLNEEQARRTLYYMERSRGHLEYGFERGVMKTPVIFSTQNFNSNGMALLAPTRIEIFSIPPSSTYSEPWLKQLAVHEYRHMVQYNNINRSTVRVLSYVAGQQAPFAATALIPFWFIEGDAVMAETQASEFGRGLQPSFNMHYRALGEELLGETGYWEIDKWFAGSIKDYVPNHYALGYQMVAHSMRHNDLYLGKSLYGYASRYPFLFATTLMALKRDYNTTPPELFRATFTELNEYWNSLPPRSDSGDVLPTGITSYTTYSYPQYIDDNTLLVLKSDYDRFSRFVVVDTHTGAEEVVMMTGFVNTRPALRDGKVWWTELRQSASWEQKVNSQLCYAVVGEWKSRDVKGAGNVLFPTPVGDGLTAYVEYDHSGTYAIVCGEHKYGFPAGVSVHGMDWDNTTQCLYVICLDDRGMGITCYDPSKELVFEVTCFSHITLSNLRAGNGKLYFGSIASGYDEIHSLDFATGYEYRITESRYGSFDPAVSPDGKELALTVYDKEGYKIAVQPIDAISEQLFHHSVGGMSGFSARNVVNPPIPLWRGEDTPLMTGMEFTEQELDKSKEKYDVRRYNRALRLFNFHSWFPFNLDPIEPDANSSLSPTVFGVTLMSQSLLGDMQTTARYAYLDEGYSLVSARLTYSGMPVRITGDFTWSNHPQNVLNVTQNTVPPPANLRDYIEANAAASLPLLVSSGYKVRWLVPSVEYLYRNTLLYDSQNRTYLNGEHRIAAALQFSEQVRMAALDIYPRWGYVIRGSVGVSAGETSELLANSWSAFGRVYVPGLARHHGLTIAAGYLDSFGGDLLYNYDFMRPKGFVDVSSRKYGAFAATYQLPLCYPDVGIRGLVFLKRVRLAASFEFARFQYLYLINANTIGKRFRAIHTTGASLYFDCGFFRLPSQATSTFSLSVYFPKGLPVYVSGGFSMPF